MEKIGEIAKQHRERQIMQLAREQVWLDKRKDEIIALHGDAKEFALRFNPDIQVSCALNLEKVANRQRSNIAPIGIRIRC